MDRNSLMALRSAAFCHGRPTVIRMWVLEHPRNVSQLRTIIPLRSRYSDTSREVCGAVSTKTKFASVGYVLKGSLSRRYLRPCATIDTVLSRKVRSESAAIPPLTAN